MKCRFCGYDNDESARFCIECGAPLRGESAPGVQTPPDACPQELDFQSPPYFSQGAGFAPDTPKKKKTGLIVLAVVALVALALVVLASVGFLFFRAGAEQTAEKFVESVILNDEAMLRSCLHPSMRESGAAEFGGYLLGIETCDAAATGTEALPGSRLREARTLLEDYGVDAVIGTLSLVRVNFTLTSGGAAYGGTAAIYVAEFDGGTYVLGGEPIALDTSFREQYYDRSGESGFFE